MQHHLSASTPEDYEENISLSEWLEMQNIWEISPQQEIINSYVSIHDDLTPYKTPFDNEIVVSVYESIYVDNESDGNQNEREEEIPKVSEVLSTTKTLLWFVEFLTDYSKILQNSITNIESVIFTVSYNQRKQQKTNYFSK